MSEDPARRGDGQLAAGGGAAARRAVVRWAWRLFRREWQAQGLVIGLLITVVSASIVSSSIASHILPAGARAVSGIATHFLRFDGSDPQQLRADLAAVNDWFGTAEVITQRSVQMPGAFDRLELRGMTPDGPYSGPMLTLRDGRYPAGGDEVAVTDRVLESFALHVGGAFSIGGRERTVVGLVENPNDLRQEFVLVDPAADESPDSVTILVQSSDEHVFGFRSPSMSARSSRGSDADGATAAALVMLGTASIGFVFVALIAVASFVVLAQRRLRQLGMLAAIGATEQHLRLVTVANGIVVGGVAALVGAAIGVATFVAIAPVLEEPFGHRIDRLGVPWWLVAAVMVLALLAATAAAWWPARTAARVPITVALSGRPPATRATRSSGARALAMTVAGVALLLIGQQTHAALLGVGTLLTIIGVLLLGPVLIRTASLLAGRLPVAARLALRDMSRYQARSGAALAAVALALFMTTSITVTASAAGLEADEGNLSGRQLMIRIGDPDAPILPPDFSPFFPVLAPADLTAREDGARRIAAQLEDARLVPLDVAFDPALGVDPRFDAISALTLAERVADGERSRNVDLTLLHVASADMLAYYGVDLPTVDPRIELLTVERGELWLSGSSRESVRVTNARPLPPRYSSLPGSFITEAALRERGWDTMRAGWFVEARAPLTSTQIAEARRMAAETGLTVEFRDQQEGLLALRGQATAASLVVALGIIAMTVGLIRSEAGRDLRTLTATGATGTTRRLITATTAGALAVLGVALGTAGAYLVLVAGYLDGSSMLGSVPLVELGVSGLGIPLAAMAMGWLMASGEPQTLTRQPIE